MLMVCVQIKDKYRKTIENADGDSKALNSELEAVCYIVLLKRIIILNI